MRDSPEYVLEGPSDHSNPVQFEAASPVVGRAAICLETVSGDSVNSILPALLDFRAVCEVTHAASKESVLRRTEGHRRVRRQDKSRPLAGFFLPVALRPSEDPPVNVRRADKA